MSFKISVKDTIKWQVFVARSAKSVLELEKDQVLEVPGDIPEASALEMIEAGLAAYIDGSDDETEESGEVEVDEVDELAETDETVTEEVEEAPKAKRTRRTTKK